MTAAPFELAGAVHLVRPAGARAATLEELWHIVEEAGPEALFFHTALARLRVATAEVAPPDDFSAWVGGVLGDLETAERMAFAIEDRGGSADGVRAAVLDALRTIPPAERPLRAVAPGAEFVLLAAECVPVPTGVVADSAEGLFEALGQADASVWFHLVVERPWFADPATPMAWLRARGEARGARVLEEEAAADRGIEVTRRRVLARWRRGRIGHSVIEAAGRSATERRAAERQAVTRLVHRLHREEDGA